MISEITTMGDSLKRSGLTRGSNMSSVNADSFSPDEYVWKGLTLTETAAKQILNLAAENPEVKGLRLAIKQSRLCRLWLCHGSGEATRR